MLCCPVAVTGLDIFPDRVVCAKNNFIDFEYVVSSIFDHDRTYDYVFCSHTLEHVPDPRGFVDRLIRMARRNVFPYVPYAEEDPIPGHRSSITEELYSPFPVERHVKIQSAGRLSKKYSGSRSERHGAGFKAALRRHRLMGSSR